MATKKLSEEQIRILRELAKYPNPKHISSTIGMRPAALGGLVRRGYATHEYAWGYNITPAGLAALAAIDSAKPTPAPEADTLRDTQPAAMRGWNCRVCGEPAMSWYKGDYPLCSEHRSMMENGFTLEDLEGKPAPVDPQAEIARLTAERDTLQRQLDAERLRIEQLQHDMALSAKAAAEDYARLASAARHVLETVDDHSADCVNEVLDAAAELGNVLIAK